MRLARPRPVSPATVYVGPADDRDHSSAVLAKLVEVALLVLVAELGGPAQQFVLGGDPGPQPSLASKARSSAYSQREAAARSDAL